VGCNDLIGEQHSQPSVKIAPNGILLEWCWRTTAYLREKNLPKGYDDWRNVGSWFSLCALFGKKPAYFSDLYPTWDNNIGFRLVCRRQND